jgi:hypothetical protein
LYIAPAACNVPEAGPAILWDRPMKDIENPRILYAKAILFLLLGALSAGLILMECPSLGVGALMAIAVWAFARAYYFAFYVIQHYIDPAFRFAGLWSVMRYLWGRRQNG